MTLVELQKLKYVAPAVVHKVPYDSVDRPYVGLEHIVSWTGEIQNDQEVKPEGIVSLFEPNDILFGKLRPYLAKVALAGFSGACSTEALVLRPRKSVWPPYLRYVLSDKRLIDAVNASTFGAKMPRASWDFIGSRKIPLPDPETQKAIAAFLDHETARTDQLVEKKQRLVELIREREESAFLGAVTGKDIVGEKTPSGVEWIGMIPAHWKAPKFTQIARQETGHTPSRKEASYWIPEECVIPWVSLADIWQVRKGHQVFISDTAEKISQIGMDNSAARLLPENTVILSRTASVGFSAIIAKPMATTQDFACWICGKNIRPKYLYYVLRAMKPEFRRLMMGSTHQTIYMPDIRAFRTPLPPLDEQDAIIQRLDTSLGRFRDAAKAIEASIDLLGEFRSALITAAVTGQIDVREKVTVVAAKPDRSQFRLVVGAEIVRRHQGNARFGRVKLQKELYLAEAHIGIVELQGNYLREAAGPLDREMLHEIERSLETAEFYTATQPDGDGNAVQYRPLAKAGQHVPELKSLLGSRANALQDLINRLRDFDSRTVEAIATLYAVWNDALMDGKQPDDAAIIKGVFTEWHVEKDKKFSQADLQGWLDWMRRNGLTPRGQGPKTRLERLFP